MTTKNIKKDENNFMNKDTIFLDTPKRPEYDNMESSSLLSSDSDSSTLSPSGERSISPFLSFPCLTRESRSYECQIESGRSMVEMLGVLAVIGVLSIGGIAGYSYGMDKYRANQTINDISLRTVDLLTQASQGHPALSFAEWENEDSIYDFSNPTYVEGENLIAFDIGTTKKLPKSVCQMVFDGLSNTVVQIDINAVHANSNETCGTDNTMTFYFEGGGNGTGGETGEQCGDTICGTCQKCDSATETCVTVANYEQKCTTDDNKTGWCVSGACEPDTTCNCDEGYYCTDTNDSGEHPTPSGNCVDAESQFRTVDIAGTTYCISNDPMSWWDAVSACKALGNRKLLAIEDIIVSNDGKIGDPTIVGEALNSEMGSKNIWTNNLYDSRQAYSVSVGTVSGNINFFACNQSSVLFYGIYAVCR